MTRTSRGPSAIAELLVTPLWVDYARRIKGLITCDSDRLKRHPQAQKHITISEVAADWHELMIPQRIAALANSWTRGAARRHTTIPIKNKWLRTTKYCNC